jgi:hypothetical protein
MNRDGWDQILDVLAAGDPMGVGASRRRTQRRDLFYNDRDNPLWRVLCAVNRNWWRSR